MSLDETIYEVLGGSTAPIRHDLAGVELVLQSVHVALSTRVGTVPLHRDWGTEQTFLDDPMPEAMAKIQTEVFDVIQRHCPRVEIEEILFDGEAMAGRLIPKVRVTINDTAE